MIAFEILNKIVTWAWSHKREAAELVLVVLILIAGWLYNKKTAELQKTKQEQGQLAADLQQQITVKNGQIEILKRDGKKVVVQHDYVPPEGSVVVKQRDLDDLNAKIDAATAALAKATTPEEKQRLLNQISDLINKKREPDVSVVIKDKGLTFKPGFRLGYSGVGVKPGLDLKIPYWGRYSGLVGGDADGIDISASRHLDDVIYGHPQNVEFYAGYKVFRFNGSQWYTFGLRANF